MRMTRWLCTDRMIAITRVVVVLELVAGGVYFGAIRPALAFDARDTMPVMTERVADLQRRMVANEQVVAAAMMDLAVLKDNMLEVKWLGRALAGAFVGQMLIGLMGRPKRSEYDGPWRRP